MSRAADAAECRGAEAMRAALGNMLAADSQAERVRLLMAALQEVVEGGPHQSRAIAGCAVSLIPVIEEGLSAVLARVRAGE